MLQKGYKNNIFFKGGKSVTVDVKNMCAWEKSVFFPPNLILRHIVILPWYEVCYNNKNYFRVKGETMKVRMEALNAKEKKEDVGDLSVFSSEITNVKEIDAMIEKRRRELQGTNRV